MVRTCDDEIIRLRDGRDLAFQIVGNTNGIPVFFFHGTPGSRYCFSSDDLLAQVPGVYYVCPDRPGYGLSHPKADRTLSDWADDVIELADNLGICRFAVAGHSGGGPHALACAWKYSDRVFAAFVFASPTPVESLKETRGMAFGNRINYYLGGRFQSLTRLLIGMGAKTFAKDPVKFLGAISRQMGGSDREVMETIMGDETQRNFFIKHLAEAYRQGTEAQFIDGQLMMSTRPWGFSFRDIKAPVYAWHGDDDRLVPPSMADRFIEIPNAEVRILENVGHFVTENASVVRSFERLLSSEWRRVGSVPRVVDQ